MARYAHALYPILKLPDAESAEAWENAEESRARSGVSHNGHDGLFWTDARDAMSGIPSVCPQENPGS